jgi:hypothetical protein
VAARGKRRKPAAYGTSACSVAADYPEFQARIGAFLQELAVLGWTIGRNVHIDTRWGGGSTAAIRKHAGELAALAPDVILPHGATTVRPLMEATRTAAKALGIVVPPGLLVAADEVIE